MWVSVCVSVVWSVRVYNEYIALLTRVLLLFLCPSFSNTAPTLRTAATFATTRRRLFAVTLASCTAMSNSAAIHRSHIPIPIRPNHQSMFQCCRCRQDRSPAMCRSSCHWCHCCLCRRLAGYLGSAFRLASCRPAARRTVVVWPGKVILKCYVILLSPFVCAFGRLSFCGFGILTAGDTMRSEGKRNSSLPKRIGWLGYCVRQYSSRAHCDFSCSDSMCDTSDKPHASAKENRKAHIQNVHH